MYTAQAQWYPSDFEAKTLLIAAAKRAAEYGWMPAGDGSISVRAGKSAVWITAASSDKRELTQNDLIRVDLRGSQTQVGRNGIPPDDLMTHLRIYKNNTEIVSILHAYPPEAAALAAEGMGVPACHVTPSAARLGAVGVIPAEESSRAPEIAAQASLSAHGILLQNDGCFTWGATPREACQKMEALEYSVNMMNKKKCAQCGKACAAGTTKCSCGGDCEHCPQALKGVTAIVRPGDTIPDRKAEATAAVQPVPAQTQKPRGGRIPELVIQPHRFTDREKQRNGNVVAAQTAEKVEKAPIVHRFSDAAAEKKPAAKAKPEAAAAVIAAPAPQLQARIPSEPVKNAPRDLVQAEVVRRLKGKL